MEPQRAKLKAMEPKGIEPQTLEHQQAELQASEPKTVDHQTFEPKTAELHATKSQIVELHITDPEVIDLEMEPQRFELKATEPKGVEFQTVEHKVVETSQRVDIQTVDYTEVDTQVTEPQATISHTAEPQKVEIQTTKPQKLEPQNSLQQVNKSQPSVVVLPDHQLIVLWHQPTLTVLYFFKELSIYIRDLIFKILHSRGIIGIVITLLITTIFLNSIHCPNNPTLFLVQKRILWSLYWFSLGMLSSIGLGTGIHTFALYLGPYIASVTVAANECGYLNFTEDSYTGVIECPQDPDPRWAVTLWNIMCKVRLESYMWGLGTAVGELPPYFMGRAARISGQEEGSDVLREFEELQRKNDECPESLTRLDRVKLLVRFLVVKAGFWGILICASIPNPFFDMAGIICGNFFVPFWTFFGATLIGKTLIKTTVQQLFIILSFNKAVLEKVVEILSKIPLVGERVQMCLSQYIAKQKEKFHKREIGDSPSNGLFSKAYHIFVIGTFLYFFISIINSLAQNHYKRLKREELKKNK